MGVLLFGQGGSLGFCMTILLALSLCYDKHVKVFVVGSIECAQCTPDIVKTWHPTSSGPHMTIDCKSSDRNLRTMRVGDIDDKGKFKINFLEAEILKDGMQKYKCLLKFHSGSGGAPCPVQKAKRTLVMIFNSIENVIQTSAMTRRLIFSSQPCISAISWLSNEDNQIISPSPGKSTGHMKRFRPSITTYTKPLRPTTPLNKNWVKLKPPVLVSRKLLTLPIQFFPPILPPLFPMIHYPSPALAPPVGNPLPRPAPTSKEPLITPPASTFKIPSSPPGPVYTKPLPPPVPAFKKPVLAPPPIYETPAPVVSIPKKPSPPLAPTYTNHHPPPTPIFKNPLPPMAAPTMYKKPLPVPPPKPELLPPIFHIPVYNKSPPPLSSTYQKHFPPHMNSPKPITQKPYAPPVPAFKKSSPPLLPPIPVEKPNSPVYPPISPSPVSNPWPEPSNEKPAQSPSSNEEPPPPASPRNSFSPIPRAPPIPTLPPIPTVPRRYFNVPKSGHQTPTPPA